MNMFCILYFAALLQWRCYLSSRVKARHHVRVSHRPVRAARQVAARLVRPRHRRSLSMQASRSSCRLRDYLNRKLALGSEVPLVVIATLIDLCTVDARVVPVLRRNQSSSSHRVLVNPVYQRRTVRTLNGLATRAGAAAASQAMPRKQSLRGPRQILVNRSCHRQQVR